MGTVDVLKVPGAISPFRARATVVSRRMQDIGLQVFHNKTAMAGLIILLIFTFLAGAAPLIAPYSPLTNVPDVGPLTRPGGDHPIATHQVDSAIDHEENCGTPTSGQVRQ